MSSGDPMTDHTAGQRDPSSPSRGSVANHDAVPAAIAPVDRLVRLGATDRESVGTDKAEPLTRDCGTGNTDARLAALEELSALDQKLELEYGLTGNPLIKAQQHTPPTRATPGEGSTHGECA